MTVSTAPGDAIERPAVTVLGLGAMGAAIARRLATRGHIVTAWNRSARPTPAGVERAGSVRAAVEASPLVIVCLLDHRASAEILAAADGTMAGRVVVDLTSTTPAQARESAAQVSAAGAQFVDGNVMADPDAVGTDRTSFLYSGPRTAFERHRRTLELLGTTQYVGSDPGHASAVFIALVAVGYETWLAYLDTLAFGLHEGIEAQALAPFVTSMFSAMSGLMDDMARAADTRDHPPAAGPLRVHAALMDDVIATRRRAGGDATQLERVKAVVDHRVDEGHGDEGFSSVIELLRPAASGRQAASSASPSSVRR